MSVHISPEYAQNPAAVFRYETDVANHFSAFDFDLNGRLEVAELALGFERLGNSKTSAWMKAVLARIVFEVELSKVSSKGDRLYDASGNVNHARVDALFASYAPNGIFDAASVKKVLADMGSLERLTKGRQYDSLLKMKPQYTKDEFVQMLQGKLMRERFLQAQPQEHPAPARTASGDSFK